MNSPRRQQRTASVGPLAIVLAAACGAPMRDADLPSDRESPRSAAPAATRFDNGRERLGDLKPLPENEVLGKDADRDHIRDDVADSIDATYGDDEVARLGARQLARALQHGLAHGEDRDLAIEAGHESGRAITCLHEKLDPEKAGDMVSDLEARTVDTEERFAAYRKLQRSVSGAYFPGSHAGGSCRFDTKGLVP